VSTTDQVPDPEVPAKARPRSYSASYKARILEEYESLDKAGKGALRLYVPFCQGLFRADRHKVFLRWATSRIHNESHPCSLSGG
jgi:hypothetical protein